MTKNEQDLLDEIAKFAENLGLVTGTFSNMRAAIAKTIGAFDILIYKHEPTGTLWGTWERPKKFTPKQFDSLWKGFSHQRRVEYVLTLIT